MGRLSQKGCGIIIVGDTDWKERAMDRE